MAFLSDEDEEISPEILQDEKFQTIIKFDKVKYDFIVFVLIKKKGKYI